MPKFSYTAMDSRGKETKGTLDVANQNEAIGRLKEMGFFPTKVMEVKAKEKAEPKGKGVAKPGGNKPGRGFRIPTFGGKVKAKIL